MCGPVRSRAVVCGLPRSRAVPCGPVRSCAVECGHVRSCAVVCGREQILLILRYNLLTPGICVRRVLRSDVAHDGCRLEHTRLDLRSRSRSQLYSSIHVFKIFKFNRRSSGRECEAHPPLRVHPISRKILLHVGGAGERWILACTAWHETALGGALPLNIIASKPLTYVITSA